MAIQNRRGVYIDFDPNKLVEGEWAVVQSGDPNSSRGRAVYMAFETGVVERMATYEDMEENIDSATASIQQAFTAELQQTISDANTTVDGLESDIADAISDANTAVSAMQTSVSNAITGVNSRMTAIETDYADLKSDNADELSSMQTQVNDAVYDTNVAIANAETATRNANQVAEEIRQIIEQGGLVASVFGRSGQVTAQQGDYTSSQITHGAGTVSDALNFDTTPISGSSRGITSSAVYTSQYYMAKSSVDSTAPTSGVEFTSADTELSPTSTESVELLNDSDIWSARLYKISQMFKNIRYLLKMLGSTDISSIGNGTITDIISTLNGSLTKNRVTYTPIFYCNSGTAPTVSNIVCYYFTIGNLMVVTGRFNLTASGSISASNPLRISRPSDFSYQNFGVGMAGMVTPPSAITTPCMLRNDSDFYITNASGSGVSLPTGYYSFLGFICLE